MAIHIFHHQIVDAVLLARVERRHDVGMEQLGGRCYFAVKTLDRSGVLHCRWRQHLERDKPFHSAMPGLENSPHAAGA